MATDDDWALAYAKQARSDLDARELILSGELPECHQLHYLQMACEKVCKAHLFSLGQSSSELRTSHNYVATVLPVLFRLVFTQTYKRELKKRAELMRHVRHLAREINFLAPAVDDGGRRKDNCEYPWLDGENVVVPSERLYSSLDLLTHPNGRLLIKLLRIAVEALCTPPPAPPQS